MASRGDPRVLFVMNALLSTAFGAVVLWGLAFLDIVAFTAVNLATMALVLMALTYVVTR
nr:hypothetical protein [Halomarina sp. PSRA2]